MIFVEHAESHQRFESMATDTRLQTGASAACPSTRPGAHNRTLHVWYSVRAGAAHVVA